ncbi:MAG: hypothetical protein HQL35_14480 [Alphaproteobacteria bacterium]|nr:hypothetical protein [Alphaproteobacteria bacterium]
MPSKIDKKLLKLIIDAEARKENLIIDDEMADALIEFFNIDDMANTISRSVANAGGSKKREIEKRLINRIHRIVRQYINVVSRTGDRLKGASVAKVEIRNFNDNPPKKFQKLAQSVHTAPFPLGCQNSSEGDIKN